MNHTIFVSQSQTNITFLHNLTKSLTKAEETILGVIYASKYFKQHKVAYFSYDHFVSSTKYSRSTVERSIKKLEALKLIELEKRPSKTHIYHLHKYFNLDNARKIFDSYFSNLFKFMLILLCSKPAPRENDVQLILKENIFILNKQLSTECRESTIGGGYTQKKEKLGMDINQYLDANLYMVDLNREERYELLKYPEESIKFAVGKLQELRKKERVHKPGKYLIRVAQIQSDKSSKAKSKVMSHNGYSVKSAETKKHLYNADSKPKVTSSQEFKLEAYKKWEPSKKAVPEDANIAFHKFDDKYRAGQLNEFALSLVPAFAEKHDARSCQRCMQQEKNPSAGMS